MAEPRLEVLQKEINDQFLDKDVKPVTTLRSRKKKLIPFKYSCEEVDKRRENGLCIFCEEQETPLHHLKHKGLVLVIVGGDDDDDQLSGDEVLDEKEIYDRDSSTQDTQSSNGILDENQVSETESSIQEMSEANEVSNEETFPKRKMVLEDSQEVMKPIKMMESDTDAGLFDDEPQVLLSDLELMESVELQSQVDLKLDKIRMDYGFDVFVVDKICLPGKMEVLPLDSKSSNHRNIAHQLLDQMPYGVTDIEKPMKLLKSWKFKFKDSLEKGYEWGLSSSNSARVNELTFSMADIVWKETRLPYVSELLRRAQFHIETGSSGRKIMLDKVKLSGYHAIISAPHMHATCLQLLEDKFQQGIRSLQVGLRIGYLTGCFALKGGAEGYVGGVDHIFELIDMSIKSVETSVVASLLKKESLSLHVGDGRKDWRELATYCALHVRAASLEVPYALLDHLKNSGPMVILVRTYFQELNVIDKSENGSIKVHTETSVSNLINQAFHDGPSGLILVEVSMHYKRWSIHKWHEWKIMLKKKRKHSKD